MYIFRKAHIANKISSGHILMSNAGFSSVECFCALFTSNLKKKFKSSLVTVAYYINISLNMHFHLQYIPVYPDL